jgi:hypothetical protein
LTETKDEKMRNDRILSNRQKSQRLPGHSLDGKGVQVGEYKDNPANHRPPKGDSQKPEVDTGGEETSERTPNTGVTKPVALPGQVDRPGFDLDGSTGETVAGKGLGLGADAMKERKGWKLPR